MRYGPRHQVFLLPARSLPDTWAVSHLFMYTQETDYASRCEQSCDWDTGMGAAGALTKLMVATRADSMEVAGFFKFDKPTLEGQPEYCNPLLGLMDVDPAAPGFADETNGVGARDAYYAYRFIAGTINSEYGGIPCHVTKSDTIHEFWFDREGYDDCFDRLVAWYADEDYLGSGSAPDTIDLPIDIGALDLYDCIGEPLAVDLTPDATTYSLVVSDTPTVAIFRGLDSLRIVPPDSTFDIPRGTHIVMEALGYYTDYQDSVRTRNVTADATWAVDSVQTSNYDLLRNVLTFTTNSSDTIEVDVLASIGGVADTVTFKLVRQTYDPPPIGLQSVWLEPADGDTLDYRPSCRTAQSPLPCALTAWAHYSSTGGDVNRTIYVNWSLLGDSPGEIDDMGRYVPPPPDSLTLPETVSVKITLGNPPFQKADSADYFLVEEGGTLRLAPQLPPEEQGIRIYAYRPPRAAPNPTGWQTSISFTLPGRADGADGEYAVRLKIYDVKGRLVRSLPFSRLRAGEYRTSWDGTNNYGSAMPAGIYFCKLVAESSHDCIAASEKIVLLR